MKSIKCRWMEVNEPLDGYFAVVLWTVLGIVVLGVAVSMFPWFCGILVRRAICV